MQDNPFAPPSAASDPAVGRGLVFSHEGAAVVASLAAWMRGLSGMYYALLALIGLGACGALFSGAGFGLALVFLVCAVGIGVMAMWLRAAATDFERGIQSDD